MPSERDKTTRQWWQVSIRELLIARLTIASALGWWLDRARLCRKVEIQKIQLEQMTTAQRRWEVKYKSFRSTIDEFLQLEHIGRPLEEFSPEELAALKKEVDARYATVRDSEPTALQVKQRMEFFRQLDELQEGEPIDRPGSFGYGPGSARVADGTQ
ncbi:MAG: hypothetical protein HYV60_07560 [Planctomycetia bacterium]|nr:hypothetical protein [Planctomycetia bacterium]